MAQLFANNVRSALNGAITNTATTINVTTGTGTKFPAPTGGDYFLATLVGLDSNGNENAWEIVKCTARATDALTVARGQESTTAVAWSSGATIELRVTAGTVDIGPNTHSAASKATPIDTDEVPLADAAASFRLKRLTWANLKATLKSYLDTLYVPLTRSINGNALSADVTISSITGNAGTATKLQTARNIDGISFDGSADVTVLAPATHAATSKATPVDADEIPIADSAATFSLKKVSWANLRATIWPALGALIAGGTEKTTLVAADTFAIADSGASNATKKATLTDVLNAAWTGLGALIAAGTSKATPVDADAFAIADSAASNASKQLTLANLKAALAAYLASLSQTLTNKALGSGTTLSADVTGSDHLLTRAMFSGCGSVFLDLGNSGTSTQTLDAHAAQHQKITATGAFTLATSNWPPTGNLGVILLQAVNFGAFTVTFPTINWIKPDGSMTTSVSTWLAAWSGRTAFQSSGTDFIKIFSSDGGTTLYGGWAA